jgi:hypothetical protein
MKNITRINIIFLLAAISLNGYGSLAYCISKIQNEKDVDEAFDASRLVLVISIKGMTYPKLTYDLLRPSLKGSIPGEGVLNYEDCAPIQKDSIYVVFLNSIEESISDKNVILLGADMDGPFVSWLASWIENKMPNKKVPSTR